MAKNASDFWGLASQQFQQSLGKNWTQALQSFQNMDLGAAATGVAGLGMQGPQVQFSPKKLQAAQEQYSKDAMALFNQGWTVSAPKGDKRFSNTAWEANPFASYSAALYTLNANTLMALADAVEGDAKTRKRIRFAVEQWVAANAPSNFLACNPEALQKAIQTQGQSIAQGMQNMLTDMQRGHISMTDEAQFELGRNLATTEGAVVFENAYFQLLEYKPLTAKVHEVPFLMVPPNINKYYILDLQPENSLVRYAVAQGHRTFVVSWRNPDESLAQATWDELIEHAVIKAITAVREISGAPQVNALGFCVGGTMLSTAMAVLAARGDKTVASATLLTTLLDFSDTGILDIFIDEAMVKYRELTLGGGGLMKGQELASTFASLRPNELVWNYVVGNYLLGDTPPAFDLLYWNSDCTNLSGPFYAWYLRNTYLENNLIKPGKVTVDGVPVDLSLVDVPVYIYGSRDDHIVPIHAAYASTQVLPGKKRFVMGASGHIAGVINPPVKNKRSHWVRADGKLPQTHAAWLEGAQEHAGSWWPDWAAWLQGHAGKLVAAPKAYGKGKYKVLEAAPGRYVKVKA